MIVIFVFCLHFMVKSLILNKIYYLISDINYSEKSFLKSVSNSFYGNFQKILFTKGGLIDKVTTFIQWMESFLTIDSIEIFNKLRLMRCPTCIYLFNLI